MCDRIGTMRVLYKYTEMRTHGAARCYSNACALCRDLAQDREAVIDPDALPLIDPKCLRSVCSACKLLCVQPEDPAWPFAIRASERNPTLPTLRSVDIMISGKRGP